MKLLIAGVSHKTAPVEIRECLAFSGPSLPGALADLKSRDGVAECLILSTCNRVEIVLAAEDHSDPGAAVEAFLAEAHGISPRTLGPHLYQYAGRDAVLHLFRVAASLDSMVVGEPQILGQLKNAHAVAKANGAVLGWLDSLLARSFGVAKRVRSETGIGQMAVSISYAAVELARKIFDTLTHRTVMIAGAGKMSELAARHLRRCGASHIFVTNRTHERAIELAKLFQGTPVEYSRFPAILPEVDILIASTGASDYILSRDDAQRVISARRNRPIFIIDISVPRNIDPAVNELDNVFLYDIDDLQGVVNANLRERLKEAEHAERIVNEEVERMMARLKVQEVAPMIVGLQDQLEQIRQTELERMRRKFGPLTPQQEEAWEALTRGIVNKIAHMPIAELRRHASSPEGAHVVETIRRVFHLK